MDNKELFKRHKINGSGITYKGYKALQRKITRKKIKRTTKHLK